MKIIRLEDSGNAVFETVLQWNYHWWGIKSEKSLDAVRYWLEHSLGSEKLPQTYVALFEGRPVGMYQLSMCDDLFGRPDLYPWLINVYVDEAFRGQQICRAMMETVPEMAKQAGLHELYLYTAHEGLYEKFGWEFVEEVKTFHEDSPLERLYRLNVVRPQR